jgi:hypothetical protein
MIVAKSTDWEGYAGGCKSGMEVVFAVFGVLSGTHDASKVSVRNRTIPAVDKQENNHPKNKILTVERRVTADWKEVSFSGRITRAGMKNNVKYALLNIIIWSR